MNLLLVENSTHLKEAVGKLPPFPDILKFQQMNQIHHELKYQGSDFSLQEEIQHFLNSAGSTSILASHDTMVDALIFLRKQVKMNSTFKPKMFVISIHPLTLGYSYVKERLTLLICIKIWYTFVVSLVIVKRAFCIS